MLYVLYGTDRKKGKEKMETLVSALQNKRPDAALLRFDEDTFSIGNLDELIFGQGLFSAKSIITLDGVFGNTEVKEAVLKRVKGIVASENVFVILAGKLDAKSKTKLEKHAGKVQNFDLAEKKARAFNTFSLADALVERNAMKLWTRYQEAKLNNVSDEEVHGLLFWQVKSVLLAADAQSSKEADLNPFVFKKATAALTQYSRTEIEKLSCDLVNMYHEARRGTYELGNALERFVLSV